VKKMPPALSRRGWGRAALLLGGGLPFYNESALAQLSHIGPLPEDAVLLNANESPLGPCPQALEAMSGVLRRGGRYLFGESLKLARILAAQEGLPADHVQVYAGSSDPLHRTVLAFCGPGRGFVAADPGYEAGARAAAFIQAGTHAVPLTPGYAHDVKAMLAAAPAAGVFYVCNPNNPTGTLTPRADIEWLLARLPSGSVLLLDEAYTHFAEGESCAGLVAKGGSLIVLRTFSKLYGMAGLRAGAALGRPDLLDRLRPFSTGYLPTTGMVGAAVSLGVKDLVPERRRMTRECREETLAWLDGRGFKFVPSVSNKFMVDCGRPARGVIAALARSNVYVGRVWPSWPNHIRVTVGLRAEMAAFRKAFAEAMSA
jgi:histidinol-phosphate/aromatic aminotransferase/cobyric acid decarboxylase-like protein